MPSVKIQRTRTFSWNDPGPGAEAAQQMSGLEFLQAMLNGHYPPPPICDLLNFRLVEVSPGRTLWIGQPWEYHANPFGTIHGGFAATLCDSAAACAIVSTLPVGVGFTTLELHLNYTRAMTVDTGRVRCIGQTIHGGRRIATAQAKLVDDNDKLYAHATTTCLVLQPE